MVPFLQRRAAQYLQLDQATRFQKVGDSFYLFRPTDCTGASNPKAFFKGAEPSWADIRDKIAPHRDAYDSVVDALFPEVADPDVGPSAYLITGSAGTGKTTLAYTLVHEMAAAFPVRVLIHVPSTPLDSRLLTPLVDLKSPERLLIVIRFAGEHIRDINLFYEELRQRRLPVTLLLEERKNQWLVATSSLGTQFHPVEFELATLSDREINLILDALGNYHCLEKLTGLTREEQVDHFTALAQEDLLVALRELTSKTRFDLIVRDEYEKIPLENAKRAYVYVAAVGQLDLSIRYETIIRLLDLRYDQLRPDILVPTEGILITADESGAARHTIGFRLRTRHPVIASVIFSVAAPDDASKFQVINGLLSQLDPGYPEDFRLLNEMVRRRELVNIFASYEMRRALFERIESILPGNPYVFQHRSIIERDMRDADRAVHYARLALKADPKNPAFENTLGLALELAARTSKDAMQSQSLLSEAEKLFDDCIKRDDSNPYGYIGKFTVMRQKLDRQNELPLKKVMKAQVLSLLEEAYEATAESAMIAVELARAREQLGSIVEGIQIIHEALKKAPADTRLRELLAKFEVQQKNPKEALRVATDGAKLDPTSWRLQRTIARLRRSLNESVETVRGHYEAAIRHKQGDVGLIVECAAYLFQMGSYDEARKMFSSISQVSLTAQEKNRIRTKWEEAPAKLKTFKGKVRRIAGATGWVAAIPDNFEVFFWRTDSPKIVSLREGDAVTFTVGFNARGPIARIL